MSREVPWAIAEMMREYGTEFKEIFNTEINRFMSCLWVIGIPDFDIVKFGELMKAYGYKDGSLADYVEKNYGKKGRELIEKLIEGE